jgi:hypothetical protein
MYIKPVIQEFYTYLYLKKISLELLDCRPRIKLYSVGEFSYFYVYFVVTSTDFLVIVSFIFDWV